MYDSVHTYSLFWRSEIRIATFWLLFCIFSLFLSHKYRDITLQWLLPYSDYYLTVTITLQWLLPYSDYYLTVTITLQWLLPYSDYYLTVTITLLPVLTINHLKSSGHL